MHNESENSENDESKQASEEEPLKPTIVNIETNVGFETILCICCLERGPISFQAFQTCKASEDEKHLICNRCFTTWGSKRCFFCEPLNDGRVVIGFSPRIRNNNIVFLDENISIDNRNINITNNNNNISIHEMDDNSTIIDLSNIYINREINRESRRGTDSFANLQLSINNINQRHVSNDNDNCYVFLVTVLCLAFCCSILFIIKYKNY